MVTSSGKLSAFLRFTLSYRDVEDLLAERGTDDRNESIRQWVLKFGPIIARNLREIRPIPYPLILAIRMHHQNLGSNISRAASIECAVATRYN
jgi:hypothetical protein